MALENFNAMGMWRDTENDQPIDATGQLITGETFSNILELKRILKENHQPEVYRCFTEKVLIYAIGRGLDYYDEHTIDQIVEKLEQEDGRFSVLITGIVESAPSRDSVLSWRRLHVHQNRNMKRSQSMKKI